jgi:ribonucleoside-diphosphate reductase alpha chain
MGNTSPSIEPFRANAYRQDTISGSYLNKNKYLVEIIAKRVTKEDEERIWSNIISNNGSVQQLPSSVLSEEEKKVFKTAFEIDQRWIIRHAVKRQPLIDQSQSLNLFIKPDIHVKELHFLHFSAWALGLKTLYYLRSTKIAEADKISSNLDISSVTSPSIIPGTEGQVCKRKTGESCFVCE